MTLLDLLRRLFGQEPPPPPPPRTSRSSRSSMSSGQTPTRGNPSVQYRDIPPPRPSANVKWKRESISVPRTGIAAWARQVTPRQKFLVTCALLVLAVTGLNALLRGAAVQRTLPATIHGYWSTDDERYAGLAMELRSHVVAFKTADSAHPIVIRPVLSVKSSQGAVITTYDVVYEAEGEPIEMRFRYQSGTPAKIVLEHQPHTIWRRSYATMLPAGY